MDQRAHSWLQVNIRFADTHSAEKAAVAHLRPWLEQAEADGAIRSWFFIRKGEWRLRYLPPDSAPEHASELVAHALNSAQSTGDVTQWTRSIYEPEVDAFGGPLSMEIAHRLFHQDSRHILDYLARGAPDNRRELTVMLCTAFLRGIGLDWFEQGDVWARAARLRHPDTEPDGHQLQSLAAGVKRLMSADVATGGRATGELAFAAQWLESFGAAGTSLGNAWSDGALTRGVRAVAAHHAIFHWNRLGLAYETQAHLAQAAREAVFGESDNP